MRKLTDIIEGRQRTSLDSVNLMSHEIADYAKKMSKKLPESVSKTLYLLQKYNITDGAVVRELASSTGTQVKKMAASLNIKPNEAQELQTMLQNLGNDIKLLPMCMSEADRLDIEAGKKALDDMTMDLETERGRSAVVKQYGALVYKIANQFVGKENLDKAELVSAGFEGLTFAINNYKKPGTRKSNDPEEEAAEKEAKSSSFKTYASYMIRNAILKEIYDNSRTIKASYYDRKIAKDKGETTNITKSLDGVMGKNDEDYAQDHQASLGTNDKAGEGKAEEQWDKLFKYLEKEFSQRDILVFLKYFGLGGHKQTKGKDIAAEFNMTPAMVTHIVTKRIIPYMKSNGNMMDILSDLLDIYSESLLVNNSYKSSQELYEMLLGDDVYLLLEEINRWRNPERLMEAISNVANEMGSIVYSILDETKLDSKPTKEIKEFLSNIYPTESFIRKSDNDVMERFLEIQTIYSKNK